MIAECHYPECDYAESDYAECVNVIMLNVIMLNVIMLNVIMLKKYFQIQNDEILKFSHCFNLSVLLKRHFWFKMEQSVYLKLT